MATPLLVLERLDERRVYGVAPGGCLLGRGPDADIRIDHSSLTRRHTEIAYAHGAWWARDNATTSGTFVDEEQIDGWTLLRPGARLQLGGVRTEVRYDPPRFTLDDAELTAAELGGRAPLGRAWLLEVPEVHLAWDPARRAIVWVSRALVVGWTEEAPLPAEPRGYPPLRLWTRPFVPGTPIPAVLAAALGQRGELPRELRTVLWWAAGRAFGDAKLNARGELVIAGSPANVEVPGALAEFARAMVPGWLEAEQALLDEASL